MSNEIFIILSSNQIAIDVFDKEKEKSIHNKIYKIENNLSDYIKLEDNLNGVLKEQIINIESMVFIWLKKIFYYIKKRKIFPFFLKQVKIDFSKKIK